MFRSIKTLLWAALVASISFGFASCSSDDDGEKPVVVETHRIPTKITEKYLASTSTGELEREYVYTISYDASNRITSVGVASESYSENQDIVYNADGIITKIGRYTYEHDTKEGRIIEYYKQGSESDVIFVDKEGYPRSYTRDHENEIVKIKTTVSLGYDVNRNLIKEDLKEVSEYERETIVSNTTFVAGYSNYYNPFVSINVPAWVYQSGLDLSDLADKFLVGKLMLAEGISKEVEITTSEGKEEEKSEETYTAKYTITKSEDNYPTELTVTSVEVEDDIERKATYIIEYKDAN